MAQETAHMNLNQGRQNIIVYREELLPYSQTYVYNQMEYLLKYRAFYIGLRPCEGVCINTPQNRTYFAAKNKMQTIFYKFTNWIPSDALQWCRQRNPVLVHAHFAEDGFVALSIARKLGLPLITSFHGSDLTLKDAWRGKTSGKLGQLYSLRRHILAKYGTAFIVPSRFLQKLAIQQGFPEKKLHLIRHGIDLSIYDPSKSTPEYGHILFVGRLINLKGLDYLIRALAPLIKTFPQIKLTVVGDGPARADWESLARKMLGDKAKFLGARSPAEIKRLLQRAYIFSMPSYTADSGQTETFGMVYIEAQAMGVPVVAFRTGGVPEVVDHERSGFLAEEKNYLKLSKYITILLSNSVLHSKMRIYAREYVEKNYKISNSVAQLENVYTKILNEWTTRRY